MPTRNVTRSIQLHPLTHNWANRVRLQSGTVPDHKLSAIDQFVRGLSNLGLYSDNASSKIQYLLIFSATSDFAGCNVPLIDISRVGNATLSNYSASSWSDSGLIGNASTAFVNTKWKPSLSPVLTAGNGHILVWKTVKNATTGVSGASEGNAEWLLGGVPGSFMLILHGASTTTTGGVALSESFDTAACHLSSRVDTSITYRRDGLLQNTISVSGVGFMCNVPFYLHAMNDNTLTAQFNSDRIFCNSLGDGLSANQCGEYFNVLALLKNRLGA